MLGFFLLSRAEINTNIRIFRAKSHSEHTCAGTRDTLLLNRRTLVHRIIRFLSIAVVAHAPQASPYNTHAYPPALYIQFQTHNFIADCFTIRNFEPGVPRGRNY